MHGTRKIVLKSGKKSTVKIREFGTCGLRRNSSYRVVNAPKSLGLKYRISFFIAGENRSYQIKNSPLVVSNQEVNAAMNQSSNGISSSFTDIKESSPLRTQGSMSKITDKR